MSSLVSDDRPDHLTRLVRTLRDAEARWRAENERLATALREERAKLGSVRDGNLALTRALADERARASQAQVATVEAQGRIEELSQQLRAARERYSEHEAERLVAEATRELAQESVAEFERRIDSLHQALTVARAAAEAKEAELQAQIEQEREAHRQREEARAQRMVELERVVERLERGRGLKRVASLEVLLESHEEALAKSDARAEELRFKLVQLEGSVAERDERLEAAAAALETAQEGFRDAWRQAGTHADRVLELEDELERRTLLEQDRPLLLGNAHAHSRKVLSRTRRALAEARASEAALLAMAEAAEATDASILQERRELFADRATVLQAVLEGRAALAALQEKLVAARRVQTLSTRLGNLVCPPGADDEREGQANYAMVLELREAQRELRQAWASVQEAEGELGLAERALDDREQGASWVRQQQRLQEALELQRDALARALEDRAEELMELERQLGDMEIKLDEQAELLSAQRSLQARLEEERETSRTARLDRARIATKLREVERARLTAEQEGSGAGAHFEELEALRKRAEAAEERAAHHERALLEARAEAEARAETDARAEADARAETQVMEELRKRAEEAEARAAHYERALLEARAEAEAQAEAMRGAERRAEEAAAQAARAAEEASAAAERERQLRQQTEREALQALGEADREREQLTERLRRLKEDHREARRRAQADEQPAGRGRPIAEGARGQEAAAPAEAALAQPSGPESSAPGSPAPRTSPLSDPLAGDDDGLRIVLGS